MADVTCPLEIAELTAKACAFTSRFEFEGDFWLFQAFADNSPIGVSAHFDSQRSHGEAWVSVRSSSWNWDGERTDIHDVIAHTVALWLYLHGHSCSLWEVDNPAVFVPTEVYSYVIRFEQGSLANLKSRDSIDKMVSELIFSLRLAWNSFWAAFWTSDKRPRDVSRYARRIMGSQGRQGFSGTNWFGSQFLYLEAQSDLDAL